MKKILALISILMICSIVNAAQVIPTSDGTKLKCTGTKTSGGISQYDNVKVVDNYEFRDGKLYSRNMFEQFARESKQNHKAQKVKKLKISDSEIKFKDVYYSQAWSNFKYVKINRNTGAYSFKAKRDNLYGGYTLKAEVSGKCSVVK